MTQLMKIKPVLGIEIINNKYFVFASATSCLRRAEIFDEGKIFAGCFRKCLLSNKS